MHTAKFLVAIVFCLTATLAHAAGFRFIEVPADAAGPALKGATWHPCAEPPGEIDLGEITAKCGFTLRRAKDCPVSGDKLPLVIISPGHGDSNSTTTRRPSTNTMSYRTQRISPSWLPVRPPWRRPYPRYAPMRPVSTARLSTSNSMRPYSRSSVPTSTTSS
jgi:hypothetical protein